MNTMIFRIVIIASFLLRVPIASGIEYPVIAHV